MINSLRYTKGNLEVKIDGHRHVLESAKTIGGVVTKQSSLSGELPIVKSVARAVFSISDRSEGAARFNPKTGLVKWNGSVITPESDLSGFPEDIAAFSMAVRTPKTISAFEAQKPIEYETREVSTSGIEMRDGVPTLVKRKQKRNKTKRVRVKNEDGSLAFTGDKPLFTEVPILKGGA